MKLYEMVGRNPGTNRLNFEWPWPKVKVTRGRSISFLQITQFNIVIKSRDKNCIVAYSIL